MSFKVVCPTCGNSLSAPDHFAGKVARCPKCKAAMTVPTLDAAGEQPIRTEPSFAPPRAEPSVPSFPKPAPPRPVSSSHSSSSPFPQPAAARPPAGPPSRPSVAPPPLPPKPASDPSTDFFSGVLGPNSGNALGPSSNYSAQGSSYSNRTKAAPVRNRMSGRLALAAAGLLMICHGAAEYLTMDWQIEELIKKENPGLRVPAAQVSQVKSEALKIMAPLLYSLVGVGILHFVLAGAYDVHPVGVTVAGIVAFALVWLYFIGNAANPAAMMRAGWIFKALTVAAYAHAIKVGSAADTTPPTRRPTL